MIESVERNHIVIPLAMPQLVKEIQADEFAQFNEIILFTMFHEMIELRDC